MAGYRSIAALAACTFFLFPVQAGAQNATAMAVSAEQMAEQAQKERERADRAEAARLAAAERATEAKRLREERIAKCVIKPVMTDSEIDYCRYAAR
jgi:hypothetical protein